MNRNEIVISPETTLFEALNKMDQIARKLLLVLDNEKFISLISVGDIQRSILKKIPLESPVSTVFRDDILVAKDTDDRKSILRMMKYERIEFMPVIDSKSNLVDILFWEDYFQDKKITSGTKLGLPVVIMAGGEGTRLRPLTNIIPKPLIPIDDKTIVEDIMDRFIDVGCKDFTFSVNYKADKIKEYFDGIPDKKYTVSYIQEDKPLGTAGSLFLLKDKLKETFFVSNCDILVDVNLKDLVDYHKKNNNVITVVSVLKNYKIPYGTIETSENGMLQSLNEKPNIVYQINSGLYILEPEIFNYLPENNFMHITDLILRLKENGKNVGVFPVSEGSWIDMGNWDEYLKIINRK
ncbi:MAG: nucleotidyltransferase family protein [Treponema sp.]|nr:nucleotidyltransferase family protein [Treponema sp.]